MYFGGYTENEIYSSKTIKVVLRYIYNSIRTNKDLTRLFRLAQNPNCPFDILDDMLKTEKPLLVEAVNSNLSYSKEKSKIAAKLRDPNCSIDDLKTYATDPVVEFRCCVAQNPNCPSDVLKKLSEDEFLDVKMAVAQNPNCPEYILNKLVSKTSDVHLTSQVLFNPNCSNDTYRKVWEIINHELMYPASIYVAKNMICSEKCPEEILHEIITYDNNFSKIFDTIFLEYLMKKYNKSKKYGDLLRQVILNATYPSSIIRNFISLSTCNSDFLEMILNKLLSNSNGQIEDILNHPNCISKFWDMVLASGNNRMICTMLKNPNCPEHILRNLSKNPSEIIQEAIAYNPNCPVDILERFTEEGKFRVLQVVTINKRINEKIIDMLIEKRHIVPLLNAAKNPNCTEACYEKMIFLESKELREIIAVRAKTGKTLSLLYAICKDKSYFDEIKIKILENEACPPEIFLSYGKLDSSYENRLVPKMFCYYYIDMLYDELNCNGFSEKFKNLYKCLEHTLMQDNIDISILLYMGSRSDFGKIKNYLNEELVRRINFIVKNSKKLKKKFSFSLVSKSDDQQILLAHDKMLGHLKGVDLDKLSPNKIPTIPSKYLNRCELFFSAVSQKPYISVDENLGIYLERNIGKRGLLKFGECPQEDASDFENWLLNKLLSLKLLKQNGKKFKANNGVSFDAYEIDNMQFIRINGKWIKIRPVKWRYAYNSLELESDNKYISMFCNNIDNLIVYSMQEEEDDVDSSLSKFKDMAILEEKKKIEQEQKSKEEEELEKLKQIDSERDEEIKSLEADILSTLAALESKTDRLDKLLGVKNSVVFPKKAHISTQFLLVEVDGHMEFRREYIPLLRLIDLSAVDSTNLKVSDIDFRGTNIRINPQVVYNRDFSNSKFDDQNFSFICFDRCNLCGTDLGQEFDCRYFVNVIVDEKTVLPEGAIVLYGEGKTEDIIRQYLVSSKRKNLS